MNQLTKGKSIYFVSDAHFGIPTSEKSRERERFFVQWLDEIKDQASDIYFMGDIFDFWFEYKTVIPKGYTRIFGKMAELSDAGIKLHYFIGNHDMWIFSYFKEELNMKIYRKAVTLKINDKVFFIGHGDGLGKGDYGYKFIKAIFSNRISQWLFRWLHPDIGVGIANYFSGRSRLANMKKESTQIDYHKESLFQFAAEYARINPVDYFIFGHRHIPIEKQINDKSTFINLGDWIHHFSYAVFDGEHAQIKKYSEK